MTARESSRQAPSAAHERGAPEVPEGLSNVLFDIWLVSRAATSLIDDALQGSGLDADEFAIYSILASTSGMTPTELSRWMAAPPTTVSSYVKRFERRGHVRRAVNPGDRRSYRVQLTAAGTSAHRAAGERFLPLLHEVTGALGATAADTHQRLHGLHESLAALDDGQRSGP